MDVLDFWGKVVPAGCHAVLEFSCFDDVRQDNVLYEVVASQPVYAFIMGHSELRDFQKGKIFYPCVSMRPDLHARLMSYHKANTGMINGDEHDWFKLVIINVSDQHVICACRVEAKQSPVHHGGWRYFKNNGNARVGLNEFCSQKTRSKPLRKEPGILGPDPRMSVIVSKTPFKVEIPK